MGIFGALTTSVTGMRAQSFALENISGNIANSQTTAFKRIDTSFEDLIPDTGATKQLAGNVTAQSRATNNVQGDIQAASVSTFMAINGDGYFVVEKPSSFVDSRPVFDGIDLYTRRGDFQPNKNGYLVNGAGYYLMGIPVDPTTGNLVGSVPTLLQFQNDFLPAQATTNIDYRANLARYPLTQAHDVNIAGSELLNPVDFIANPVAGSPQPATITGTGATLSPDAMASLGINNGDTFTVSDGTNTTTYTVAAGQTIQNLLDTINNTAGTLSGTFTAPMLFDNAGDQLNFNIQVDGGTTIPISITQADVLAVGNLDNSIDTAAEMRAILTNKFTAANVPATVSGAGNTVTITSNTNGAPSSVVISGTTAVNGGGAALANTSGVADGTDNGSGAAVQVTIDGTGHLKLTAEDYIDTITVSGTAASTLGFGAGHDTFNPTNLLQQSAVSQGQTFIVTTNDGVNPPVTQTITFGTGVGEVATLAQFKTALQALTNVNADVDTATGNVTITALNLTDTIDVTGTAQSQLQVFGMHTTAALPSNQTVIANDLTPFLAETISGQAITAYDVSGSPVNIQLRWGKIDSATLGGSHVDKWNLFYQVDSNATGTGVAWRNVGTDFIFGANGQMNPAVANLTVNNLTVDGINLGNVQFTFGSGGLTQFSDPNGNAQVNLIQQNGFAAGSLQSIAVNDKGRVVGSYSNGRSIDLAQIALATFKGPNFLKRIDGGAFEVTDESGAAILGASGKIVSSSLEGSNTDIGDEFTKLIVTQQAYSANTRVITTANTMVQDLLNMLR
jgi:flagellar hook protein FlgE